MLQLIKSLYTVEILKIHLYAEKYQNLLSTMMQLEFTESKFIEIQQAPKTY